MAYYLIRWAMPHKGKPKHLTSLEYYLRWLVFLPLWCITFVPMAIAILCVAFIGPLGFAAFIGLTGIGSGAFIGFTSEDKASMFLAGLVLAVSFVVNQLIQHRFLTQR
jgi:ABC-type proline/glycine betaine transport system permease subunit